MRALIVDDECTNRKILKKLWTPYGESCAATNGKEALELVIEAYGNDKPFDIIFVDILMPELTGIQLVEKIRHHESDIDVLGMDQSKIVMVTGLDCSVQKASSFKVGCEGFLNKPVQFDEYKCLLNQLGLANE